MNAKKIRKSMFDFCALHLSAVDAMASTDRVPSSFYPYSR
jgi:hypothetical protein